MSRENGKPIMVLRTEVKELTVNTDICFWSFYETGMVCVYLPTERKVEETQALKKQLKADGIGLLKAKIILTKYWRGYGDKYYKYSADELLNDNEKNFFVPYEEVRLFKFTAAIIDDNDDMVSEGKIEVRYGKSKLKYVHDYQDDNGNIKKVLEERMSKVLKYKKEIICGFSKKRIFDDSKVRRQYGS